MFLSETSRDIFLDALSHQEDMAAPNGLKPGATYMSRAKLQIEHALA